MSKQKWYVVWSGKKPGIYNSWSETEPLVKGFTGAKYQSFKTKYAAEEAFNCGPGTFQDIRSKVLPNIIKNSICVDAACSGNPGTVEYRGVYTETGTEIFHKKIDGLGTNNLGEFLAIVHALAWQHQERVNLPIYTDSGTAMAWLKNKKIKSTLVNDASTAPIFELIDRAHQWLTEQPVDRDILKWITSDWGEIPADFGRK